MNLYHVIFTVALHPGVRNCITFGPNELAARSKIAMLYPTEKVDIRHVVHVKTEVYFAP